MKFIYEKFLNEYSVYTDQSVYLGSISFDDDTQEYLFHEDWHLFDGLPIKHLKEIAFFLQDRNEQINT